MARDTKPAAPAPLPDYKAVADAIARIGNGAQAMKESGMTHNAVLALLKDATGLPKSTINTVIKAQQDLTRWCLSK